tara:strand:+ start:1452 stop:1643 length:192 start_codon:yes stop_codon:yes gene_type:complete
MAITKTEMLAKIEERKTEATAALSTLVADGDISDAATEVKLWNLLSAVAVTQPLVKKYIEDNY